MYPECMSEPSKTPQTDPISASPGGVEILRSGFQEFISGASPVSMDGEFAWPIPPSSLGLLYRASSEHCRAINIKAEGAFGGGLTGDKAELINALCEGGAAEMFTSLGLDLETYGNAFLQVIRSRTDGRIVRLRRLPAITMSRFRRGFLQRTTKPNGDIKRTTFTEKEIVHLREPCPMGKRYAFPTWIGAEGMLKLTTAATRFNEAFFENGAMPEYAVVFSGGAPTKEEKAVIAEFFRNEYRGPDNAHRTLIIHGGEDRKVEFKRLTSELKDGDFLKLLDAARDRMPVAHGVPSRMMGIMSGGQLGGGGEVAQQLFVFEVLTLRPKRRRMLDQIAPQLAELDVKPGDLEEGLATNEIAFRPVDLTPPKDDAEDLPNLVSSGIVTADEARAIIPFLQGSEGRSGGAGAPIARSAPTPQEDRLVALLEKL